MEHRYSPLTPRISVTSVSSGMDSVDTERSSQSLAGALINDTLMAETASYFSWALPGNDGADTFCLSRALKPSEL